MLVVDLVEAAKQLEGGVVEEPYCSISLAKAQVVGSNSFVAGSTHKQLGALGGSLEVAALNLGVDFLGEKLAKPLQARRSLTDGKLSRNGWTS